MGMVQDRLILGNIARTGVATWHSNLQRNNPLLNRQLRIALHSVQSYRATSVSKCYPQLNHAAKWPATLRWKSWRNMTWECRQTRKSSSHVFSRR